MGATPARVPGAGCKTSQNCLVTWLSSINIGALGELLLDARPQCPIGPRGMHQRQVRWY
jgi:hypothetical protein